MPGLFDGFEGYRVLTDVDVDRALNCAVVAVTDLLARLETEGQVHAEVVREAAARGGTISREVVYEICGYDPALTTLAAEPIQVRRPSDVSSAEPGRGPLQWSADFADDG